MDELTVMSVDHGHWRETQLPSQLAVCREFTLTTRNGEHPTRTSVFDVCRSVEDKSTTNGNRSALISAPSRNDPVQSMSAVRLSSMASLSIDS